ncbi:MULTISPECIES: MaoC family dehydratase [Hydrocarboniphaga]|jgi:acyl dehydratase|uniref:MaoC-like dehydratase n=1 Tax=Hydrocarboniphaga effusa AP103 TaxID=1172194 RepID=I7Z9Q1_9GAMM|nr:MULTISPECIES: MaoC family dehydratase [Hydrocarboniphaga]EIT68402.1 MaoC-like dehydratase [Hydrocarboniphaga effusa AP103]MDZ4078611.1 MaoC family dehydratase [Hydrocarboniphaga sp.]
MIQDNQYRMSTVAQFVGNELGVSDWVEVGQDRINTFADCTGDHQWIHTDVERCHRESPFGAPIAHGFLSLSMLAKLLFDVGVVPSDAGRAINAGLSEVRFRAPVRANSRIRARVKLESAAPKSEGRLLLQVSAVLEIENEKEPALQAQIAVMLLP